ncbi:hypothetical protein N4T77_00060 [Clostridium sp. CX1]|uniref:hypothetical protein n=1 Tax=Clostridium sp. CX1 TaxID=2978346 RepID=UPI0021C1791F|nr:hypothetical protein [Clostridium sp. CX1]MCT8974981.1 hypothetical protein [Clostridium sp. CX1]
MKKKLKIILIPVLIIVIVALVIVGISLNNRNKEKKRIENMNQSFRAENLRGLWNVEGENFTLLFYQDSQLKMHIRSSYRFDPKVANPIIDSIVDDDNLSGKGVISAFDSPNSNVGISLYAKDESNNSYTILLDFCDLNQNAKTIYTKEVKISKSPMNFSSSGKEDILKMTTDLLMEKFKNYNGEKWVPMNITLDEINNADGLIDGGEISGKALMVKSGLNGTDGLQISFSIEVTTKPFQFRELNVNGNNIIHHYKTE